MMQYTVLLFLYDPFLLVKAQINVMQNVSTIQYVISFLCMFFFFGLLFPNILPNSDAAAGQVPRGRRQPARPTLLFRSRNPMHAPKQPNWLRICREPSPGARNEPFGEPTKLFSSFDFSFPACHTSKHRYPTNNKQHPAQVGHASCMAI